MHVLLRPRLHRVDMHAMLFSVFFAAQLVVYIVALFQKI